MQAHFYTEVVILGKKKSLRTGIILQEKISDSFQYCYSSSLPRTTHVSAFGAQSTFRLRPIRQQLIVLGLEMQSSKGKHTERVCNNQS